ncbi:hypothetical protein OG342_04820 [Streptomyces bobili]|uniref:hypothetical protein n=1 Tax=Streptomyces bobili TaxID=67280 RepID=UPI002251C6C8|nr:hypothetical protein [Streptomyces bobili]MCX5522191.1 hypothetical protein [Streptomyces bobili]
MAEKWEVSETITRQIGEQTCWQVSLVRPDGNTVNHIMPTSALDWRAAEYGIDPTDTETLMEILLHEPHMAMVDDPQHGSQYADSGPDLWAADNTDTAREAHVARIKDCIVHIDVKGARALDPVRSGHRPDLARIRRMREEVDTSRWLKKYGDLPAPPIPDVPPVSGNPTPSIPTPLRRP